MLLKFFLQNGLEAQAEGSPSELAELLTQLNAGSSRNSAHPAQRPQTILPSNNRQAVLKTMEFLQNQGRSVAHIAEIKVAFRQLFPQSSSRLIDQILRDLVNKTGQLRRVGRGLFEIKNPLTTENKAKN